MSDAATVRSLLGHPIHHRFAPTGESIPAASDDDSAIDFHRHTENGCQGCAALASLDAAEGHIQEVIDLVEGGNVPQITSGANFTASHLKGALRLLRDGAL